jgi:putative transposase
VERLCAVLEVSRSGYYRWRRHAPSKRAQADTILRQRIGALHRRSRRTYGSPRIHRDLRDEGIRCGRHRVARLMRQTGLRGAQKRRFRPRTTDSRHARPVHPNRLQFVAVVSQPKVVWVSDLTYISTQEGWLYLAAFMDLGSRRIMGWALRDSLHTDLVTAAFRRAVADGSPPPGLIVHSDRGIQYASEAFGKLLQAYRFEGSMSRVGNVYDNAAMESFWATLKTELPQGGTFPSKAEARLAIFDYIEGFYNRWRRHSALGYLSPLAFEAKFRHESVPPLLSEKAG